MATSPTCTTSTCPTPRTDAYVSSATGPGEANHEAQLQAYDAAFAAFFQNLAAHGIDKSNTLFVVTVDEGDHFAGGTATPAGCDGVNIACNYTHTICTTLSACPANQIGEVDANMKALLAPAYAPNPCPHSTSTSTTRRPSTSTANLARPTGAAHARTQCGRADLG